MIIDAHIRLGGDVVFDEENREGELIRYYNEFQVDDGTIQPLIPRPYPLEYVKIHDRVVSFCKSVAPRKHFFGMVSINPHFFPENYNKEAFRYIKELGLATIRATPVAHACHPSSKDAYHMYEVCRELKVPLMIHTDNGILFVDSMSIYQDVKDYPDVTMILMHMGSEFFHQQTRLPARKPDNVFLEPSWYSTNAVKHMIQKVGCSKILFPSDSLDQIPVELAKYRQVIRNEDDLKNMMQRSTNRIFRLGLWFIP